MSLVDLIERMKITRYSLNWNGSNFTVKWASEQRLLTTGRFSGIVTGTTAEEALSKALREVGNVLY